MLISIGDDNGVFHGTSILKYNLTILTSKEAFNIL